MKYAKKCSSVISNIPKSRDSEDRTLPSKVYKDRLSMPESRYSDPSSEKFSYLKTKGEVGRHKRIPNEHFVLFYYVLGSWPWEEVDIKNTTDCSIH